MLYRELKSQGFALLTVTQDPGSDVLKMVEYNGITHPIVSDTKDPVAGNVYEKYHAYDGKHYLITSDGTIVGAFSKLAVSMPVFRRELAKHGIGAVTDSTPKVASSPVPAATSGADPVAWKISAKPLTAAPGAAMSVTLDAVIAPGWHIYAIDQRGGGPTPLTIQLPDGQPFRLARAVAFSKPEVKFDPGFGLDVSLHQDRAQFAVPVDVIPAAKTGRQTLTVEARYQACNANICLPPQTDQVRIVVTVAK